MNILGISRFSMIGRGDWKAFRGVDEAELEEIYRQKEVELFDRERLEVRLQTFEHLTLASLAAQTNGDFKFLVVSSDRMPPAYRERLSALCNRYKFVTLKFVPPMHIVDAQKLMLDEMSLDQAECLQFRLDDDDAVSVHFVQRLSEHASGVWSSHDTFAISFPNILYSVIGGDTEGVYKWFNPYLGIGLAVRNRKRSVYGYAHYRIPQAIIGITDPRLVNLVTHYGMNDTPRHPKERLKKRGLVKCEPHDISQVVNEHFHYLSPEGARLAGIPQL